MSSCHSRPLRNTKEDIFKNAGVQKNLLPTDLQNKQMKNTGDIFQNISFFVLQKKKKSIQIWNDMKEKDLNFEVNCASNVRVVLNVYLC